MQEVTARLKGEHPTGERWRGGVKWGYSWKTVELSADDAAKVAADPMLEVMPDAPEESADEAADEAVDVLTATDETGTIVATTEATDHASVFSKAKKAITGKK